MEFDVCQCLYKTIGNHLACWDVQEFNLLGCNLIANIIVLDVYIFGLGIEEWVVGLGN